MVLYILIGICGSVVAMAMMIAMLKCCIESLAQGTDDQQKLGMINTYQSRYGNTYRRNTYDTDDLTEVWTTNDNNGTGRLSGFLAHC